MKYLCLIIILFIFIQNGLAQDDSFELPPSGSNHILAQELLVKLYNEHLLGAIEHYSHIDFKYPYQVQNKLNDVFIAGITDVLTILGVTKLVNIGPHFINGAKTIAKSYSKVENVFSNDLYTYTDSGIQLSRTVNQSSIKQRSDLESLQKKVGRAAAEAIPIMGTAIKYIQYQNLRGDIDRYVFDTVLSMCYIILQDKSFVQDFILTHYFILRSNHQTQERLLPYLKGILLWKAEMLAQIYIYEEGMKRGRRISNFSELEARLPAKYTRLLQIDIDYNSIYRFVMVIQGFNVVAEAVAMQALHQHKPLDW